MKNLKMTVTCPASEDDLAMNRNREKELDKEIFGPD